MTDNKGDLQRRDLIEMSSVFLRVRLKTKRKTTRPDCCFMEAVGVDRRSPKVKLGEVEVGEFKIFRLNFMFKAEHGPFAGAPSFMIEG